MNTIGHFPSYPCDAAALDNVRVSQSTRASLDTRANTEISLVTADGDRVTLSASSALQATYSTYDYLGRIGGQALAARNENLQVAGSDAFSLTVDGELDQEELADIHKLLNALETAAADAFSGNGVPLTDSLADFGSLGSIESFNAILSYSRTVSAEQTSSAATAGEASAQDAAEAEPVTGPRETRNIKPLLNRLAQAARRLEHENRLDKVPKRFMRLLKKFAHDPAFAEDGKS